MLNCYQCATVKERIFKVAVLFMSSGEKWARCGFMGCCWLGYVCESMKSTRERQTDRERDGKQEERVLGKEVCHARQTTQQDSDLFGNC